MRRLIAITADGESFREKERIVNMVRSGEYSFVHIRKPSFTEEKMKDYLSFFPMDVRERLSLHQFQHLAKEMQIGGVHLNRCFPSVTEELKHKRITASCHSFEELSERKKYCEYCFISPVFDSISKQGYKAAFSKEELLNAFREGILDSKAVALGGVTKSNISLLESIGFTSFAMLSSAWTLPEMMFISHADSVENYISSCMEVMESGVKFIQIRMKDSTDEDVVKVAEALRKTADRNNVLMTVDDRIELLSTGLFDGVHVGKNDMPVKEAKRLTGNRYLLGATCNTEEDIVNAVNSGADYIGMGPYRFTTTKKNLAPVLGAEGYRKAINNVKPAIPIYAIGGIRMEDMELLRATGVYGVALSSMILESKDIKDTMEKINKTFIK